MCDNYDHVVANKRLIHTYILKICGLIIKSDNLWVFNKFMCPHIPISLFLSTYFRKHVYVSFPNMYSCLCYFKTFYLHLLWGSWHLSLLIGQTSVSFNNYVDKNRQVGGQQYSIISHVNKGQVVCKICIHNSQLMNDPPMRFVMYCQ